MRVLALLFLVPFAGCGASPSCTGDVQWAPFSVDTFTPFCDGDALEIREFAASEYIVDVNAQFRDIDGSGAVDAEWSLSFDGVVSHLETEQNVPSYDTETGWWRVHVIHRLSQTDPAEVAGLDGATATLEATFTDENGRRASSSVDLVAAPALSGR